MILILCHSGTLCENSLVPVESISCSDQHRFGATAVLMPDQSILKCRHGRIPQILALGFDRQELDSPDGGIWRAAYRASQLLDGLYRQRSSSIDEFPPCRRAPTQLARTGYPVGLPGSRQRFVSIDGTVRYLMAFADGETVETVWMPEGDGGEAATERGGDWRTHAESSAGARGARPKDSSLERETNREPEPALTICVSSQVGCAVNCQFCLTALLGVKRNLTAGEIVGRSCRPQTPAGFSAADRINLVFMGMGEPFLNYDNFMKAVRLLAEEAGIPESRMTVSTSGIVPRIHDFGEEPSAPSWPSRSMPPTTSCAPGSCP